MPDVRRRVTTPCLGLLCLLCAGPVAQAQGIAEVGADPLAALLPQPPRLPEPPGSPAAGIDGPGPGFAPGDPIGAGAVPLYLEVFVNGRSTRLIAQFTLDPRTGRMSAPRSELIEVGIDPGRHRGRVVPLDAVEGIAYAYDAAAQTIAITAADAALRPAVLSAGRTAEMRLPDRTYGAVVNLGASFGFESEDLGHGGSLGLDGLTIGTDAWIFTPFGHLSNNAVLGFDAQGSGTVQRYETRYEVSSPRRALTFGVGDVVSGSLAWGRSVRLGGVQLRREFGLRADLVTEPLLSYSGAAAVPSSIDVFIDNNRVYSGSVERGPYRLEDVPIYGGSGDALVVVRGEDGEVRTREVAFFASRNLLKHGVADFSLEAGHAREGYGIDNARYGEDLLAGASLRYGLTDRLTLEAHAEGTRDLVMAGAGMTAVVGDRVEVGLSGGRSRHGERVGGFAYGTLRTQLLGLELEASSLRAGDGFADLAYVTALDYLDAATVSQDGSLLQFPRAQDVFSLTYAPPGQGPSFGLGAIRAERADARDELLSVSYSRSLDWRDASIGLSGAWDRVDRDLRLSALISIPLGRASAQASIQDDARGTIGSLSALRPMGEAIGDVGLRASLERSDREAVLAGAAALRSRYGVAEVSGRASGGAWDGQVRLDGAVVLSQGRLAAGNTVRDGFVIVDVGVPDVPVFLQNREVARTDGTGRALVPGLASYAPNRISVDVDDIPVGTRVAATAMDVVPARRSGVLVDLGGDARRAGLVTLRDAGGAYLPVGSRARLDATGEEFVVGYDGQVYAVGLEAANRLVVQGPAGACVAEFALPPGSAAQAMIDDVTCR